MENKDFTDFMLALKSWAEEENQDRSVSLNFSPRRDANMKIWCYDYPLQAGKIVDSIKDIPTIDELKEIKKQNLLRELDSL